MPKLIYAGTGTYEQVPVYKEETTTVDDTITDSNVETYFTKTDGSPYTFSYDSTNSRWQSTNYNVSSSTATLTLVSKGDYTISFNYQVSSESSYDKYTITVDGTTVASAISGAGSVLSCNGSIANGQSIVFTYTKDSSMNKNDDRAYFSNFKVSGTSTVQTIDHYDDVEVTKKVNTIYYGVNGAAKNVKTVYLGVDGVAKRVFNDSMEINYYGTAESLSETVEELAATTVGNYALFGGGNSESVGGILDVYDVSLTKSTARDLDGGGSSLAATTVGNYALFGGGFITSSRSEVTAYDTSLTRSTPDDLSVARHDLAATTVGNYALFGGGTTSASNPSSYQQSTVDAYDTSLTRSTPKELSNKTYNLAATTVGNYALFGGGTYDGSDVITAYNKSLTRSVPTALSCVRSNLAAGTVGNYALFCNIKSTVDAYDTSLTRSNPTSLSVPRNYLAATTVGNYALFGGGYGGYGIGACDIVDAYDTSLTRSTSKELSVARYNLAATTVGNYALFGGGYGGYDIGRYDIVDVYEYS